MQAWVAATKKRSVGSWLATLVVAALVISIVVAIATPNLLRSRIAANESSAVGSIRTINTALVTYSGQHPGAGYPRDLSDLASDIGPSLASGRKSGYSFRYEPQTPDVDGVVRRFRVNARPVAPGESGKRSFSSNESGVISVRSGAAGHEEPLDDGLSQQSVPRSAPPSRRMVRKASLTLIVTDPAAAAEKIRVIANRFNGYVDSVRSSDEGAGARQASIVIRIPSVRFDDARREARAVGERLRNEEDDARDVTGQYVDLESNLRNYHAEEAQYLEIMRRSGSIKDTLAVAERLADVRGRIERTQAQLYLLAHQTEMAVLEVTLCMEALAQPVDVHWHPQAEVKAAFWSAADDLSTYANFMIAVLFRLPIFLLWAASGLLFAGGSWRLLCWMWKRLFPARLAGGGTSVPAI